MFIVKTQTDKWYDWVLIYYVNMIGKKILLWNDLFFNDNKIFKHL